MIHGDSGLSAPGVHAHHALRRRRPAAPRRAGCAAASTLREPQGTGASGASSGGTARSLGARSSAPAMVPDRPGGWHAGAVHELIALLLPGGDDLVAAVRRAWDAGDAVLPARPRRTPGTPGPGHAALAPTAVVEADGEARGAARAAARSRPATHWSSPPRAPRATPKGAVHTHRSDRARRASPRRSPRASPRTLAGWPVCRCRTSAGFSVVTRALRRPAPGLEVHARADADAIDDAAERRGDPRVARADAARPHRRRLGGARSCSAARPSPPTDRRTRSPPTA